MTNDAESLRLASELREAIEDPQEIKLTILGRNGRLFTTTMPIDIHEQATINGTMRYHRSEGDQEGNFEARSFPIPYVSRRRTVTLNIEVVPR